MESYSFTLTPKDIIAAVTQCSRDFDLAGIVQEPAQGERMLGTLNIVLRKLQLKWSVSCLYCISRNYNEPVLRN